MWVETRKNISFLRVLLMKVSNSLSEMWLKWDLIKKQRVQNLVFPEGLRFNKEKNDYRTLCVNSFFVAIALLSSRLKQKKNGTFDRNIEDSASVPRVGIEPTSPWGHWCLRPARLPVPPSGHFTTFLNIPHQVECKNLNSFALIFFVVEPKSNFASEL